MGIAKARKFIIKVCRYCDSSYILGIDGVVGGCDSCLEVRRKTDGRLIYPSEMKGVTYSSIKSQLR